MKSWMKTSLMAALAATTLLGSGVAAAQCGGYGWGGGRGWGGGHHGWGGAWRNASPEQIREQMDRRMELQLARLELALALTPEQRPAWANFKKETEDNSDAMFKGMERWRDANQSWTASERLARTEEFSRVRETMLGNMRKSVEAFYGKLSAPQKTVFDAELAFLLPMHGGGACGMGGPGCMADDFGYGRGNAGFGRGGRRGWR